MQLAAIPRSDDATPVDSCLDLDAHAAIAEGLVDAGRRGERTAGEARAASARRDLEWVVGAYWRALASSRPLRAPFGSAREEPALSRLAGDAPIWATRFGRAAAHLSPVEAGHAFGQFYTAMLPSALRKRLGIFYTSPSLADHLMRRAAQAGADWATARILEPACGGGAILLPALGQMLDALPQDDPDAVLDHVATHLRGVDLDPTAAWLAQVLLDATLLPWTDATSRTAPRLIEVGCALNTDLGGPFDVILGNPPYGVVALDAAQKARFICSVQGRANLYGLFLDRAIELASTGGTVAMITPTSWLGGKYFRNLRHHMTSEASPVNLDFISARAGVFDAVQQQTMVSTWRRGAKSGAIRVAEAHVRTDVVELHSLGVALIPADPGLPWPLPRRADQVEIVRAMEQMSDCLGDWGYRVRTGSTEAPRVKARLAHAPGPHRVPLIWADMVGPVRKGFDGHPDGLIWPDSRRGRPTWFDAGDLDRHLVRVPALLLQRTTAPEQPRRLVGSVLTDTFLAQHGPVAVENHLNIIEPTRANPLVDLTTVAAFLASEAADAAFRCISGSINVSAYELASLPLPPAAVLTPLSRLVAGGAAQAEIDAECWRICRGAPGRAPSVNCPGPRYSIVACVQDLSAPDQPALRRPH